ncbi:hypothetical protein GCM10009757_38840 [Streptomyces cheonanensis]|uniref:Uncharacterized protein n=1 Tax=Streptomyces cheonanensis TaxID=312720 RepID=A0ABP5GVJ1_9ACTN
MAADMKSSDSREHPDKPKRSTDPGTRIPAPAPEHRLAPTAAAFPSDRGPLIGSTVPGSDPFPGRPGALRAV